MAISFRSFSLANAVLIATLLISFMVPFTWVLSTSLIWELGKNISGNVSDFAISLPSGIPLLFIMSVSWVLCFLMAEQKIKSMVRLALISNTLAVIVFCISFIVSFGMADWSFIVADEIHIFPIRLLVGIFISFSCTALTAIYLLPRFFPANKTIAS